MTDGELEQFIVLDRLGVADRFPAEALPQTKTINELIEKLNVNLIFDKALSEDKAKLAVKLVQDYLTFLPRNKKVINSRKETLTTILPKKPFEYINEYKEALMPSTILLALIVLSVLALISFFIKYILEKQKLSIMEKAATYNNSPMDADNSDAEDEQIESTGQSDETTIINKYGNQTHFELALERVRELLTSNVGELASLIRQWIHSRPKNYDIGLHLLSQTLKLNEIKDISDQLSEKEKDQWHSTLTTVDENYDVDVASQFLVEKVSELLIKPITVKNSDLRVLASGLSRKEVFDVVSQNAKLGGYLINILPSDLVSHVLKDLSLNSYHNAVNAAKEFDEFKLSTYESTALFELKSHLEKSDAATAPFIDKLEYFLDDLSIEKEGALLSVLLEAKQADRVIKLTKSLPPADVIMTLERESLRKILDSLEQTQRVELITSRDEKQQDYFLSLYDDAPKAQDVLDFEVAKLMDSETEFKAIEKRREEIWKVFIQASRAQIKKDTEIQVDFDEKHEAWLISQGILQPEERAHAA